MELRKACEDLLELEARRLQNASYQQKLFCAKIRQLTTGDGGRTLTSLVDVLLNGSRGDLEQFIDDNLKAPMGIQHRVLLALKGLVQQEQLACIPSIRTNASLSSTTRKLFMQWKSGTISQVQYFSLINNCLYHNTINSSTAKELINSALADGGYGREKFVWNQQMLYRRNSVDFALCSLSEMSQLYTHSGNDLSLYTCASKAVSLSSSSDQWTLHDISPRCADCTPCVSTDRVYWSHEGGCHHGLILVHSANYDVKHTIDSTTLRIVIGDSVTLPCGGVLDVDQVISVDAKVSTDYGSAGVTCVAFLIEGKLIDRGFPVQNAANHLDGATELGVRDNDGNDSDGSDSEGLGGAAYVVQVRRQYWSVSALIHRGIVKILNAIPIYNTVFKDQVPFQVICLARELVVISGTNGLLATVSGSSVNLLPADNSALSLDGSPAKVSHAADATVSAVSCCSERGLLCSGDSNGVVCFWSVNWSTGTGMLLANPIQIEQNGKICSLYMSPSGAHVAVALWDRLVLLVLSKLAGNNQTNSRFQSLPYGLYVRSNLDITMNNFAAKYSVAFGQQFIRIWRVINQPTDSAERDVSGIRVTTWLHPNLDSLESRCGLLSTNAARTADINGGNSGGDDAPSVSSSSGESYGTNLEFHRSDSLHTPSLETARDSEPMDVESGNNEEEGTTVISGVSSTHVLVNSEPVPLYRRSFINFSEGTSTHWSSGQSFSVTRTAVAIPDSSGVGVSSSKFVARIKSLRSETCMDDSTNDMVLDKDTDGTPTLPPPSLVSLSLREIYRPLRAEQLREDNQRFLALMSHSFVHDRSDKFLRIRSLLVVYCACYQPPTLGLLSAALDLSIKETASLINNLLDDLLNSVQGGESESVTLRLSCVGINKWLCSANYLRMNRDFWMDVSAGHNTLCALYLRHCGNKSVAMEHPWQDYLRTFGASHLRRSSRGLRALTAHIRKIDETANIKHNLPYQIGYIVGLQEIYARRVGLGGIIPPELGELAQLRVLSMGNNRLCGELPASLGQLRHLQRIVLHQNNLQGSVPPTLGSLGCIVNLAGNSRLEHGADVPAMEREALCDLFHSTRGPKWNNKTLWCSQHPVAKWYKVGVLSSHVHSIVMSSNGMEGRLLPSIGNLSHLRMIELATMPGLVSSIPKELCNLTSLRRLCICRCSLTGKIPPEIGQLTGLEELQLFGNQLVGGIPSSVGNLVNLKLLSFGEYTGGNNFTPAPLPPCLASLVNLEALFMANCNLKGSLPDWIGNLKELRQLDLQRNNFTGGLPPAVGQLQNLLYLNIKDNENLTGKLPIYELMSLVKLNRLSLVHCNFQETETDVEILRNHLPRCKIWI